MILKLTDEQRQAVASSQAPVRLVDEQTQTAYVLLREELYQQLKGLIEDEELDIREAYPLIDSVAAKEGWDDPELDSYNALDPRRKP